MITTISAVALALLGVAGPSPGQTTRPISNAESVFAVYVEDWGRPPDGKDRSGLVLAIWPDGYAVWSEDKLKGGPPYRAGLIASEKVSALLDKTRQDGLFTLPDLNRAHFGPDSTYTTLFVKSGGDTCKMQSWHELFEADARIVVTDTGATGIEEGTRLARLREEEASYLFYRFVWSELQTQLLRLLPADSHPVEGHFNRDNTGHTWEESSAPEQERGGVEATPKKN